MSDPILTSLCSICHVSAPKYKCPGCSVSTCSLPCVEKHKKWTECSGHRSQTAYVPPNKLRTAAGIDHDYNFLYSLDRAREASEKELEERGLISRSELYPVMVEHVMDRRGQKFVATRPHVKGGNLKRMADEGMRHRLADFDIQLFRAPSGLNKAKTAGTRFTKARRRIEWQVEWLAMPSAFPGDWTLPQQEVDPKEKLVPTAVRLETKTMDDCPVIQGFAAAMRQLDPTRQAAKKTGGGSRQGKEEDDVMAHVQMGGASAGLGVAGMTLEELGGRFAFFLRQPLPSADSKVGLRPLDATEHVGENLRGSVIFEHPSIYVFKKTEMPPVEWVMPFDREALLEVKRRRDEEREAKKKVWKGKKAGDVEPDVTREDPADTTSSEGSEWSESDEESEEEEKDVKMESDIEMS